MRVTWGLVEDNLTVSKEVKHLTCDTCNRNISCSADELPMLLDKLCLHRACGGHYKISTDVDLYYKKLYKEGEVHRINSGEHTGLLTRETRENLEQEFINNRYSWNVNLLSCTPTLEMGIDIGDLSSLILCSVPPEPANYVQRMGRAGRRDGNAFGLTITNANPHDLYHFSEPEDMIEGRVKAPGCFLSFGKAVNGIFPG